MQEEFETLNWVKGMVAESRSWSRENGYEVEHIAIGEAAFEAIRTDSRALMLGLGDSLRILGIEVKLDLSLRPFEIKTAYRE